MNCNYRYCNKEIVWGRPDRKFCNKNCKSKENAISKELKALNRRSKKFLAQISFFHTNIHDATLKTISVCNYLT